MSNNDMNNSEVIRELSDKFFPELSSVGDLRGIPLVYSHDDFKKRLSELDSKAVFILASHILDMKNELLSGVVNAFLSEIAERIKNAGEIYGVESCCLASLYPFFTGDNDTYSFINRDEGEKFVEELAEKTGEKVKLKKYDSVPEYFMVLSRYGAEYIRIEPGLCRLRYSQTQLVSNSFESISGNSLNRSILKFLQAQEGKRSVKERAVLELKMLEAIRKGSFACKGITVNGSFEAVLINDQDGKKWIPIYTDTTEVQDTYLRVKDMSRLFVTSEVVTVSFSELRRYMDLDKVSGIVINIGGYGLRLPKERCRLLIDLGKLGRK